MNATVKIKEPWWGAWKRFGWEKGCWGVGISQKEIDEYVEKGMTVCIEIWKFKEKYYATAQAIKDYSISHNTNYTAKGDTKLYVIPKTMLEAKFVSPIVQEESFTCCSVVNEPVGTVMRCPVCKENTVTVGEE